MRIEEIGEYVVVATETVEYFHQMFCVLAAIEKKKDLVICTGVYHWNDKVFDTNCGDIEPLEFISKFLHTDGVLVIRKELYENWKRCAPEQLLHTYIWMAIREKRTIGFVKNVFRCKIRTDWRALNKCVYRTGSIIKNPLLFCKIPNFCYRTRFPEETGRAEIIILSKDVTQLKRCLSYVKKNTRYGNYGITVRWGGQKNVIEPLCRSLTAIQYQRQGFNYSRANNAVIDCLNAVDYYVLLNDDVCVLDGWLRNLVWECDGSCVVGGKLMYPKTWYDEIGPDWITHKRRVQHAGVWLRGGVAGNIEVNSGIYFKDNLTREIEAVTFAMALISREAIERVGMLDEEFPVDYNDVDYCVRVRKAGGKVIYNPDAIAFHDESATRKADPAPERLRINEKARVRMKEKHGGEI